MATSNSSVDIPMSRSNIHESDTDSDFDVDVKPKAPAIAEEPIDVVTPSSSPFLIDDPCCVDTTAMAAVGVVLHQTIRPERLRSLRCCRREARVVLRHYQAEILR